MENALKLTAGRGNWLGGHLIYLSSNAHSSEPINNQTISPIVQNEMHWFSTRRNPRQLLILRQTYGMFYIGYRGFMEDISSISRGACLLLLISC